MMQELVTVNKDARVDALSSCYLKAIKWII